MLVALAGPDSDKLLEALKSIREVKKIVPDPVDEHVFMLYFEQHVDPFDPKSPVFLQRVFLNHADFHAPVVVELEGYECESATRGELTEILHANQIGIEHRFFGASFPKGEVPYQNLTIRNAAEDQHRIIEAFKRALYPDNFWVSTGISKGGQTTLIHRSFYPQDVDASVCYVAPLNFAREDPRIHSFLESVGTPEQRERVRQVQLICLERKNELLRELELKMKENRWSWSFPPEVALEYYILEYSFAFWQWGDGEFDQLPDYASSARDALNHVLNVSGVSFFEDKGVQRLRSYFYTALTEEGIYDYDTTGFSKLLSRKEYNFEFALPAGFEHATFDPEKMKQVNDFLQNDAQRMLFIYGELDPWSATAVNLPEHAEQRQLYKFVRKGGNHATRILNMDTQVQKQILDILSSWKSRQNEP
jgi:hypothetical protein